MHKDINAKKDHKKNYYSQILWLEYKKLVEAVKFFYLVELAMHLYLKVLGPRDFCWQCLAVCVRLRFQSCPMMLSVVFLLVLHRH